MSASVSVVSVIAPAAAHPEHHAMTVTPVVHVTAGVDVSVNVSGSPGAILNTGYPGSGVNEGVAGESTIAVRNTVDGLARVDARVGPVRVPDLLVVNTQGLYRSGMGS